jgi:predicted metal-binding protein
MTYSKPNTSPEYRADAAECLDRAQRALEVAEVNLDTVSALFNQNKTRVSFADLIGHAEARTRLGDGWLALAMVKGELR